MVRLRGPLPYQKPPLGSRLDPDHPLTRDLIGYWPLNEGAGSVVHDIAGHRHDGAVVTGGGGPISWAGTTYGLGLSLPGGADGRIRVATGPLIWGSPAGSITALVSSAAGNGVNQTIYSEDAPSGTVFALLIQGGGLTLQLFQAGGSFASLDAGPLPSGWHLVTATWDTAHAWHVYVDGELAASSTAWDGTWNANAIVSASWGGITNGGLNYTWSGGFAGLALYSRALSPADIAQLHAAPFQMFLPPIYRRYFVAAAGGVTHPVTLAATSASAALLVKQAGKLLAVSGTSAAGMTRQTGKMLAGTSSGAPALTKQTGKGLPATSTSLAGLNKRVGKGLAATASSATALTALKVALVTLAATSASVAGMQRTVGKALVVVGTSAPALTKAVGKTLVATATSRATLTKLVRLTLAATSASNALLNAIRAIVGAILPGRLKGSDAARGGLAGADAGIGKIEGGDETL